ncbi:MAG TPA: hypothetical protein VJ397_03720, partial [Thermoplasmata archaeon]|nr:hypothetical protein [Thermoplasmata archaeon]
MTGGTRDRSGARLNTVLGALLVVNLASFPMLFLATPSAAAPCAAPCVTLLSPNGGEDLTGGSSPEVVFFLDSLSGAPSLWLAVFYTSGGPWVEIANVTNPGLQEGLNSRYYVLPYDNTTTARLRIGVDIVGEGSVFDDSDADFAVDAARPTVTWSPLTPSVPTPAPSCGPIAPITGVAVDVEFTFSEPVNTSSFEAEFHGIPILFDEATGDFLSTTQWDAADFLFSWDPARTRVRVTPVAPSPPFADILLWTYYFRDDSVPGNLAGQQTLAYFSTEAVNAAPAVAVTVPSGGERWTGGTPHDLVINLTDDGRFPCAPEPLSVAVSYAPAVGNGTIFEGTLYPGENVLPWTTPDLSFPAYVVTVTATDAGALVSELPL